MLQSISLLCGHLRAASLNSLQFLPYSKGPPVPPPSVEKGATSTCDATHLFLSSLHDMIWTVSRTATHDQHSWYLRCIAYGSFTDDGGSDNSLKTFHESQLTLRCFMRHDGVSITSRWGGQLHFHHGWVNNPPNVIYITHTPILLSPFCVLRTYI